MPFQHCKSWAAIVVALVLALTATVLRAEDADDEVVKMVVGLLSEPDKEMRSLALDQVRTQAKGLAATKTFAAQLPKLPPATQAALIAALADRGDASARPAVLELLNSSGDAPVRLAAIAALGTLGTSADLELLVKLLASKAANERAAAEMSLNRLSSADASSVIAGKLNAAAPPVKVALLDVLVARRASKTAPQILPLATDADAAVRAAALAALGQIGTSEQIPGLVHSLLKAATGDERETVAKAIALVCGRTEDATARAEPLLQAYDRLDPSQQILVLPALGRVGGAAALKRVETALDSHDSPRSEAALHALCNWPDASVADRLLQLTKDAANPDQRSLLFQGLTRVSAVRDKNANDLGRLARMRQALELANTDEERKTVLTRCRTAYAVETLRLVLPYVEQPKFAQIACETIVELAHHREIREPNKAEFEIALDRVQKISKDPVVIERAGLYKRGETWIRPKPAAK